MMKQDGTDPILTALLYAAGICVWAFFWWNGSLAWMNPVLPSWAERGSSQLTRSSTDADVLLVATPTPIGRRTATPRECEFERKLVEAIKLNPEEAHGLPGCPTVTPARAQELVEAWTSEFLDAIPVSAREVLRPAVRTYYLAATELDKWRAMNEMMQTALLWRNANRSTIVVSDRTSPWLQSDIRSLEREVDRLDRCVRFGGC